MVASTQKGDWWCGLVVKFRDSREITKTRDENGVVVFSSEKLADGETHAEANFFIAHRSNGRGLYCYHHLAATMGGDFASILEKHYRDAIRSKKKEIDNTSGISSREARRQKKLLKGKLCLEQILKPGTFKQHLRTLKKITAFEAGLVSFETSSPLFKPLEKYARRKKVRLLLDPSAPANIIADSICGMLDENEIESGHVEGKDALGENQSYQFFSDPSVFAEWDFDETMANVVVRFDGSPSSITGASPVKKLLGLAKDASVLAALGM